MSQVTADRETDQEDVLDILSCGVRRKILRAIAGYPKCNSELMDLFAMGQQAITHHLVLLKISRLVESDRVKRRIYYRLTNRGHAAMNAMKTLEGTP